MDALGLMRQVERRHVAHRAVPASIAKAASARWPAARSRRWRASAIRRHSRSSRQLAIDTWADGRDATALAVAFARERLLKDGSIALIRQALDDEVAPCPGARLPRRARRRRAVILPVDFYRRPTLDSRARPDRQGPRLQVGRRHAAGAIVEAEAYIGEDDPGVPRGRRSNRRAMRRSMVRPAAPTSISTTDCTTW